MWPRVSAADLRGKGGRIATWRPTRPSALRALPAPFRGAHDHRHQPPRAHSPVRRFGGRRSAIGAQRLRPHLRGKDPGVSAHLHSCTLGGTCDTVAPVPSPYNAARVAVDEPTWKEFRQAALARGIPVSAYLGKLVAAEVSRRRGSSAARVDPELPAPDQALIALEAVRASIDELDDIAGRLARSAAEQGGSWEDVGSSLRMDPETARTAYERPGGRSLS